MNNVRLVDIRKSSNLLQREVAEKANISREHYTQIESGVRKPSLQVAVDLAKALDIPLEEFFLAINVT